MSGVERKGSDDDVETLGTTVMMSSSAGITEQSPLLTPEQSLDGLSLDIHLITSKPICDISVFKHLLVVDSPLYFSGKAKSDSDFICGAVICMLLTAEGWLGTIVIVFPSLLTTSGCFPLEGKEILDIGLVVDELLSISSTRGIGESSITDIIESEKKEAMNFHAKVEIGKNVEYQI